MASGHDSIILLQISEGKCVLESCELENAAAVGNNKGRDPVAQLVEHGANNARVMGSEQRMSCLECIELLQMKASAIYMNMLLMYFHIMNYNGDSFFIIYVYC